MLSRENNETLVRVGPGTAMGALFRLYWTPCFPSEQLLADGQPKPVRLLGEDLILFRDSEGRPGLVGNACPHQGGSLCDGMVEGDIVVCPRERALFPDITVEEGIRIFHTGGVALPPIVKR